jgi:ADP-ribosylglycohydrolase
MIIGGVVGDALGVPYEFIDRKSMKLNPCIEMIGYGTHDQPIGTWSDDTSLTLAFIDSLSDGFDINKFANNSLAWKRCYNYTPHGELFDIGISTSNAINKYEMGFDPYKCGGTSISDNGNGALMRIHPLLKLVSIDMSMDIKYNLVKESSCLTHNHPISHISCLFYIEFLLHIYNGFNKIQSYEKSIVNINNYISDVDDLIQYRSHFDRIFNNINTLNEDQIFSSGYVVHTLEASIWCFLNSSDYKESVLKAVNLGNDTDTISSITGCLSGLYYGIDQIPNKWIDNIVELEYIKSYARKLSS